MLRFGAEPGAEEASFEACVGGTLIVTQIAAEREAARRRDVQLFLAPFVNGCKIEGVPAWEGLCQVIGGSMALVPAPTTIGRQPLRSVMPLLQITIDPIIAQLGPVQLGWHGIFSMVALLVGVWLGLRRAAQLGLDTDVMASGLGWVIAGAVVGARLFHVLDHIPYYAQHPVEIVMVWQGGIAVYGGFVGGVLAGAFAAWKLGVPVWKSLDAAAPAMLVGQAIGRIGCLINGDAWGAPTGCACGVVYWNEHALLPPDLIGVPTHPYALYEIGAVAVLLGILWMLRGRGFRPGTTFLVMTFGYGVIRFLLTFFRQETVIVFGLQEAQLIALATCAIAVAIMVSRLLLRREPVAVAP